MGHNLAKNASFFKRSKNENSEKMRASFDTNHAPLPLEAIPPRRFQIPQKGPQNRFRPTVWPNRHVSAANLLCRVPTRPYAHPHTHFSGQGHRTDLGEKFKKWIFLSQKMALASLSKQHLEFCKSDHKQGS